MIFVALGFLLFAVVAGEPRSLPALQNGTADMPPVVIGRLGKLTGPQPWRPPTVAQIKELQSDKLIVAHPHTLLSVERKYMLCVMQKVGCSNWLHYVKKQHGSKLLGRGDLYINAQEPTRDLYRLNRDLSKIRGLEPKVFDMLQNDPDFFTAAIVRDPWTRAVSGYRDKIYGLSYLKAWGYGLRTRRTLEGISDKDAKKPHKLTFHEFIEAVREMKTRAKFGVNAHFMPQTRLCKLDSFPYHYIAELHNETDLEYVRLKMGFNVSFAVAEKSNIERYELSDFGGLPGIKIFPCTTETVDIFAELYREDYETLGYTLDAAYYSCRVYGLTSIPGQHEHGHGRTTSLSASRVVPRARKTGVEEQVVAAPPPAHRHIRSQDANVSHEATTANVVMLQ